ncbi:Calcium permeable stress-gated cation channel 1 [Spatholobus suberectus]|nr:Calcium permeable stress-gated cation channel 1 [Spatholobus suberectus]
MPAALRMPEPELIDHAGLDSVVYLRIYLIGLKIFVPIAFLAWAVLVPVNWTSTGLESAGTNNITSSDIDKLSISNVHGGSERFWTHIVVAYAFTFWTCYILLKEYEKVALMRLHFVAAQKRRPDQFTVLVRNIPPDPDEPVSELVEHFFLVNHPDNYLTHQVVYNANKLAKLVKKKKKLQNWLVYYQNKLERTSKRPEIKTGFLGLCGKKVDAIDHHNTEIDRLSKEIALERDKVTNDPKSIMPAAFVSFKTRWGAAVCAQTQQTRNPTLWLTEWAPEPRDVYWLNLAIPYVSLTVRRLIVAVAFFFLTFFFMIPIAIVQSLASLDGIQKAAPWLKPLIEIYPITIGTAIPLRASFFITYIMVDGWAGIAAEEEAMDAGSIGFNTGEPRIQLYFLLGLVYAAVTPSVLPFIIVFFGLAYVVFRHQIINVYNQEYESGAAFWPDVHLRVVIALIVSQIVLMGLLSTKKVASSAPFLIALPVLTIWFHIYCKGRFEPAFVRYPLQETMMKDTLERATEPNLNLKPYLQNAYVHPVFKASMGDDDDDEEAMSQKWETESVTVPTKRQSRRNTPLPSRISGASSPSLPDGIRHHPEP